MDGLAKDQTYDRGGGVSCGGFFGGFLEAFFLCGGWESPARE